VPVKRGQTASKTYPSELAEPRINGGVPTVTKEEGESKSVNGRF